MGAPFMLGPDEGLLTQEEFDQKKREVLDL